MQNQRDAGDGGCGSPDKRRKLEGVKAEQDVKQEPPAQEPSKLASIIEQEIEKRVDEERKVARMARRELRKASEAKEEQWEKIRELRRKLKAAREEASQAKEEAMKAKEETQEIRIERDNASQNLKNFKRDARAAEQELEKLKQRLVELERELDRNKDYLRISEANLVGANTQRGEDKRAIEWYKNKEKKHSEEVVNISNANLRQLEEVKKKANEAREALEARLKNSENTLALAQSENHTTLSNKRREYTEALQKLEEKQKGEVERLKAEATELNAKHATELNAKHKTDIERLRGLHQASSQRLRAELEGGKAETERLKAELERGKAETGRLKAELEEGKAESGRLKAELEEGKAESGRLKAELDANKAEATKLNVKHTQQVDELKRTHEIAIRTAMALSHDDTWDNFNSAYKVQAEGLERELKTERERAAALQGQLDAESADLKTRTDRFTRLIQGIPEVTEQCLAARNTNPMTMHLANFRPTPGETDRVKQEYEARIRELISRHEAELRAEVTRHDETKYRLNFAEQAKTTAERHAEQTYQMYMGTLHVVRPPQQPL